jgi:DNA-binding transcriptional regulator GbsR (MarR family)
MDRMGSTSGQSVGNGGNLQTWENIVTDAVGRVIDFWGFKHNHGRTWGLLYLRNEPMSASDLREALGLSKGAVSMITKDLRQWGVVQRTRVAESRATHYLAERDFLGMIQHVIEDRELEMVDTVRGDLEDALEEAREQNAPEETIERIRGMYRLADMAQNALELFLSSARLDVTGAEDIL